MKAPGIGQLQWKNVLHLLQYFPVECSNMLSYHPYLHNPFSFFNYECTDSWSTSFSGHMTSSLPPCVHYIYYVYKLATPHGLMLLLISLISWLKKTLFYIGITGNESYNFKGHRLLDTVIHTHKFTILKSDSKGGVAAMFWTVEMRTHPVYCCARGQFQRQQELSVWKVFTTACTGGFQDQYFPCYHKAWKLYFLPSWDIISKNYSSLNGM